jgi:hypothetical protein
VKSPRRDLRRRAAALVLAVLAAAWGHAPAAEPPVGGVEPVVLDFFFEPGCTQCARVREEVLPELVARYEGSYVLAEHDIGVKENYLTLVRYQESLGKVENVSVSMVVDRSHILNGFEEIAAGLFPLMDQLSQEHLAGRARIPPPPQAAAEVPEDSLRERARGFTLLGVLGAGLVDGINPCAISTLVFFMSLLSVLKVSGRRLALVGGAFVLSSFVTYTAIGFGLFRFLHLFAGFTRVRATVNLVMVGILGVFALLSFLDAWRYRRSHRAQDVHLQLPDSLKMRIHKIMRGGLHMGSLTLGSIVIGSSVTVLESVCTGQVYVPTLVMLIKGGHADLSSFLFLLLYNLMFQVPIVVVFVLTLQGMKAQSLLDWSRRNVAASKVVMGCFFVAMAALILWL